MVGQHEAAVFLRFTQHNIYDPVAQQRHCPPQPHAVIRKVGAGAAEAHVVREGGELEVTRTGLLAFPVHDDGVVTERLPEPAGVGRVAVGDAARILRQELPLPVEHKTQLVRVAVAAAVGAVVQGDVVLGDVPVSSLRSRRAAAKDDVARVREHGRAQGEILRFTEVRAKEQRLLALPAGPQDGEQVAGVAPVRVRQLVHPPLRERVGPAAVVECREDAAGRHEPKRRVVHALVAVSVDVDAHVPRGYRERLQRAHRIEVVAPRALIPEPVVGHALLDLRPKTLRPVDGVGGELLLAEGQAHQPVRRIVPAADVVDAPLVVVDEPRRGQEELLRDGLDVGFAEGVVDAVKALRHRNQPRRFVKRLRANMAAALLRLPVDVVQRVVQVPLGIAQEYLARLRRIGVVSGEDVHQPAVANRPGEGAVLTVQDDIVPRPARVDFPTIGASVLGGRLGLQPRPAGLARIPVPPLPAPVGVLGRLLQPVVGRLLEGQIDGLELGRPLHSRQDLVGLLPRDQQTRVLQLAQRHRQTQLDGLVHVCHTLGSNHECCR